MRKKIALAAICFLALVIIVLVILLWNVSPIQLRRTVFDFQVNTEIPQTPETYVVANPQVLAHCEVHTEGVDSSLLAVYPAYVLYEGRRFDFQINIADHKIPELALKDSRVVVNCFVNSSYQAKDLVTVKDDSKTNIYFEDAGGNQSEAITFDHAGNYEYWIYAKDSSDNFARVRIRFDVKEDTVPPVISGVEPQTLSVGEEFDAMAGVSAVDNADGDVTMRLEVTGQADLSKAGQYYLTYRVYDNAGNLAREQRQITVIESGMTGAPDVGNGPFLTSDQIKARDLIVASLLDTEMTAFDDREFLRQMNHYLVTHFQPGMENSSYHVLVNQRGDAMAMARAVKVILDQRGIQNVIVQADGKAWNIVQVDNVYRHIDVYTNATRGEDTCFLLRTAELDASYNFDPASYPACE